MGKVIGNTWAAALFLCTASWAQAALVTYTFQDVVFIDGGTLSGFFTLDPTLTYDKAAGTTFDFDIKTAGGNRGLTPFEYTPARSMRATYQFLFQDRKGFLVVNDVDGSGITHEIGLHLPSPNGLPSGLIDTIPLSNPDLPQGGHEFNSNFTVPPETILQRYVESGSAIGAVPEPETYAFMLAGLMLVAGGFRKRFSL